MKMAFLRKCTIGGVREILIFYYELGLPPGTWTIVAQKLGYQYGYIYDVVVEENETTANVDFILEPHPVFPIQIL